MNIRPVFGLLLLLLPVAAKAQISPPIIPHDTKFEASFTISGQTGNPFDPADNDVDVTFTGPRSAKVVQPAFWDGDRWRVRYAPPAVGTYTLSVLRNGTAIAPADLSASRFRCVSSSEPGFVRRDPKTVQGFIFDNGSAYYPLGMDVAWLNGGQTYDATFTQMQAAHMNWARVWATVFDNTNFEWAPSKADDPKPGTLLVDVARRWDAIFDFAEKHGIYIQMTLQHHGEYTAHTDPNWADNPFNAANGGFLQHPDDFFTDAEARRLTKLKYRYITARYGYSTHLLSYELFNEVQNITEVQNHFQDVVNWHKEMASAIRAEDVNHHLLTTSNSVPGDPLAQIGLDYDQIHSYVPDIISFFSGVHGTGAPVFVGEWGPADTKTGLTAAFLHDGLWAGLMAPTAGAGQFWYWDNVESNKWWPQFTSATAFLKQLAPGSQPGFAAMHARIQSSGTRGDLSFAPTGGWQPFTRETAALTSDGAAPDLSGFSTFIQGTGHRDMMPQPLTFTLNCPAACQFQLSIATVSKVGAHAVVLVDGKPGTEADYPAASDNHDINQTLSVDLPAGPHQVSVNNTGVDWFTVKQFTITHYAPPLGALAKGNSHSALFWVYNRDRSGSSPASATLLLPGLTPGTYTVHLWDTWAGHALPPIKAAAHGGIVTVTLPAVARDIAGSILPEN
ncbi:MAG: DUF5060 domain-containing protein [Janthinobacterium lividum]